MVLDDNTYQYYKRFKLASSQKDFNTILAHAPNNEFINDSLFDTFYNLSQPNSTLEDYQCDIYTHLLQSKDVFLQFYQQTISINYDKLSTLDSVINKFWHLKTGIAIKPHTIIIGRKGQEYYLENNIGTAWTWETKNAHLFQGKFSFEVLNCIHQKTEPDWIGTFHATTIGNGEQAVMLVGNSGSGKSTLATLLMYAGYDLVADDMSAMLASNNHIAVLPAALSVKEKAFTTIAPLVDNFEALPQQYINSTKGRVTYIPPLPLKHPEKLDYPCKNLVLVRYSQDPIPTTLTEGAEQTILQELITESWLAHNEHHAQSFLNWLGTVNFYELKYHKNNEAIAAIDSLF